jgi:hypothetical protein
MVKICQTGLLKLYFEIIYQKTHFPVFAKNFRRPWMKLKNFFPSFQILGPLGCQGWVVIPQNVKKSKSLHPIVYVGTYQSPLLAFLQIFCQKMFDHDGKDQKVV